MKLVICYSIFRTFDIYAHVYLVFLLILPYIKKLMLHNRIHDVEKFKSDTRYVLHVNNYCYNNSILSFLFICGGGLGPIKLAKCFSKLFCCRIQTGRRCCSKFQRGNETPFCRVLIKGLVGG